MSLDFELVVSSIEDFVSFGIGQRGKSHSTFSEKVIFLFALWEYYTHFIKNILTINILNIAVNTMEFIDIWHYLLTYCSMKIPIGK